MPQYEVILFYKYVHIENPHQLMKQQKAVQDRLALHGRTIIASEGVNVTVEGTRENIALYLEDLQQDPRFADLHIKRSVSDGEAFPKAMVKVRDEIVSLGLGVCDIDPNEVTGQRLQPDELHQWINSGKEFYIVDMRNAYEHMFGYFEGSIRPAMDNFRDLPKFLESIEHLKNKTVLTVCTGGVRCEKASGYLLQNGFTDVYQLDGGIVSYMEKYPNENFIGKLYVFDNRIAMGFHTDDPKHQIVGRCVECGAMCERLTNCANDDCHRQLLACEHCQWLAGQTFLCRQGCKQKTRVT